MRELSVPVTSECVVTDLEEVMLHRNERQFRASFHLARLSSLTSAPSNFCTITNVRFGDATPQQPMTQRMSSMAREDHIKRSFQYLS